MGLSFRFIRKRAEHEAVGERRSLYPSYSFAPPGFLFLRKATTLSFLRNRVDKDQRQTIHAESNCNVGQIRCYTGAKKF